MQLVLPIAEAEEVSRAASFEERARAKLVFAEIYRKLGTKMSLADSGVAWAQRIMDQAACGKNVEPIQVEMAARALIRDGGLPIEDEFEAARERAAIQCEHLPILTSV
jgi:hypothetical protein